MDETLYKFLGKTVCACNNKMLIDGIFCDFYKAFAYINHELLISKLKCYNLTVV